MPLPWRDAVTLELGIQVDTAHDTGSPQLFRMIFGENGAPELKPCRHTGVFGLTPLTDIRPQRKLHFTPDPG